MVAGLAEDSCSPHSSQKSGGARETWGENTPFQPTPRDHLLAAQAATDLVVDSLVTTAPHDLVTFQALRTSWICVVHQHTDPSPSRVPGSVGTPPHCCPVLLSVPTRLLPAPAAAPLRSISSPLPAALSASCLPWPFCASQTEAARQLGWLPLPTELVRLASSWFPGSGSEPCLS